MFTWKRIALASGCFILLVFFFITLILPGIVVTKAQQWVAEETGRILEIGSLRINPVLLSVEITGLSLSEKHHAKAFISWDSLQVSLSPKSIFYRAPVISELRLDHPVVNLERLTADTFNFSDLIPVRAQKVPAETSAEPARFSVSNLTIKDGQINLVDSSLAEPVHHTVRDLQLVLPVIGNLPSMIGNPTKPMFHAVINDAPIHIEGELKPFSKIQEMKVALALQDIDLPFYLGYIPIEMPVNLRNGRLSLDLNLVYRVSEDKGNEFEMSGKLDLASLDIWDKQQQKLFFLPLLRAEIAPSQPLKKQIHLSALRVYNLEVQLNRDQQGAWNHARMAPAGGSSHPQEKPEETSTPLRLMVDTFEVRDGVIVFADHLPNGGFNSVVREINIDVKNFALDAKQGIPFNLSMETERKEIASGKGQFMLEPFTLDLDIDLRNLNLAAYQPYYHDVYAGPLGGYLGLRAKLATNREQPLLISNGVITWQDPYMAFNQQEGVGASRVEINGLSFDLKQNRLEVDSALYQDGRVNFSRNAEGKWSFLSRNFPILAKLTESPGAKPSPATEQAAPAFNYRIGELALRNWKFDVRDSLPEKPVELEASDFNLTFNNLAAPENVKSPFTFSTTLQRKGKVEIKGTASLADQSLSLQAGLKRIPLATFAPYVAEQVNLVLADGYLDARLTSDINAGVQPLKASVRGDVGVSQFHLLDGLHSEDLLKWDSLQIAGIETQLSPVVVAIKSITLSDYFAKVLIDEKSRLNLTEAFHKEPSGPPGKIPEAPDQGAADELPAGQPATPPPSHVARIDTIILQGGQVDFTDRHLSRPFHADMRELGGRIEGLTSDLESRATVDLRGKLRNQSPLAISGTVNPLAEKLFLDLKLSFTDIELSPLSPYSGTYVGYLIRKGKLNLSLAYFIEDDMLKAKNEVFLDQFSFGEKVESDQAINLPVKLAVALLKDRNGEIHLDIPVSGSLDDPQFSITGVVWTIIKNLLVKAATSPFALLGALVGGGDEDFSSVNFEPGSARLSDPEKDKLQHMSKALAERPGIDIEISGFIDPENDPEGYRRELLSKQIKRAKYLDLIKNDKLPEGINQENVTVSAEEYPDYLWEVYQQADFPKPRNFIGMTKKLPVAEMEKLIYASDTVSEENLASLAQARAQTVQNFLTEEGQVAKERVFLKEQNISAAPDPKTAHRARVELGVTVR
jgi:uncharacterized protein involved in outer membrane biogenesis